MYKSKRCPVWLIVVSLPAKVEIAESCNLQKLPLKNRITSCDWPIQNKVLTNCGKYNSPPSASLNSTQSPFKTAEITQIAYLLACPKSATLHNFTLASSMSQLLVSTALQVFVLLVGTSPSCCTNTWRAVLPLRSAYSSWSTEFFVGLCLDKPSSVPQKIQYFILLGHDVPYF